VHGTFLFFYGRPERLACRLRHGGANSVRLRVEARQWRSAAKGRVCHSRGLWRCHRDATPDWRHNDPLSMEMLEKAAKAQPVAAIVGKRNAIATGLPSSRAIRLGYSG